MPCLYKTRKGQRDMNFVGKSVANSKNSECYGQGLDFGTDLEIFAVCVPPCLKIIT